MSGNQTPETVPPETESTPAVPIENPPIQDILLPMDSAGIGKYGLDYIWPIVQCCGATIHALYVRRSPGVYKRDRIRFDPDAALGDLSERFEREMEHRGLEVKSTIRKGTPKSEIQTYAEENDVDLILMTTHARTGINRIFHGSVTEAVMRNSSVPVMVVRHED